MRKLVLLTAVVAMMGTTAYAAMPVGSFALGWVNMDAPIGIRYQIAEKIAGDVGVGFASWDGGNTAGIKTQVNVDVGVPIELVAHDRCSLDFRPGATFYYYSPENSDWDSYVDVAIHGWLAFNLMITDNFGLNAAHGVDIWINAEQKRNGDVYQKSTTNIFDFAGDVTNMGLYFWF